jgi:hypothetical protein
MPRNGLGMPIVSGASNAPVTIIDDVLWEDFGGSGGEIAVNYQETRTNSVLYSQDTTQAEQWTKTNTAIDSTLYEAPDNSTTANAIKSNSTGTKVYRILQSSLSVTTGKTYTLSVHVKKGTLGFARVQFNDSSVDYRADFNLNTAAVTNTSNTIRTQVDSMDDDWYRCSITFQAQNTTSSGTAYVFAQSAAGSSTPNVAVSDVILLYVWGFQLEESIEATSYIVTTTEARTATTTLNDTSDVWDFDGADLMPEADPNNEGVWEEGSNLVTNHDYEDLGSELVTNGGFDTDSNWTFAGTNGAVSNGVGVFADTTNSYIIQSSVVPASVKQYKLQYEVIESNGGGLGLSGGSSAFGAVNLTSSVGVHTKFITSNGSQTNLQFNNQTSFIGKIDNISVKQVDPNDRWTLSNTTISDGVLNFPDNSSAAKYAVHTNTSMMDIGSAYEITLNVNKTGGGILTVLSGTGASALTPAISISSSGTQTFRVTNDTNGSKLFLYTTAGENFQGTVDNITVREYAIQPQDV